jgi:branched-chain amino acid transport system permease protein
VRVAVDLFANVVLLSAIFALVNVGLVVLYRSTGVLSFAQGHLLMFGAYIMSTLQPVTGYWTALTVTVVVIAAMGLIIYVTTMRFMLGASEFEKVVMSFLVALVLTQIVAIVWGTQARSIYAPTDRVLSLGGGTLPWSSIISLFLAVGVVTALTLLVFRTVPGLRMRALAQNETLAVYSGMRVHRLSALAWVVAGATAAIAGVVYAQTSSVTFSLADIGLLAFPAAVLGGLKSIAGSLVGSIILATIFTLANYALGGVLGGSVVYLVMLAVLLVLPFGLFGRQTAQRL